MAASGVDSVGLITGSLSSLADEHGSDKGFGSGLRHCYTRAYASALSSYRDKPLKPLEIGLLVARDWVYCPSSVASFRGGAWVVRRDHR